MTNLYYRIGIVVALAAVVAVVILLKTGHPGVQKGEAVVAVDSLSTEQIPVDTIV